MANGGEPRSPCTPPNHENCVVAGVTQTSRKVVDFSTYIRCNAQLKTQRLCRIGMNVRIEKDQRSRRQEMHEVT